MGKEDSLIVTTEVPGIDPENINVSVTGANLTISGISKADPIKEGETYLRQERELGSFQRNVQLPFQVNPQAVEDKNTRREILKITLPKDKRKICPGKSKLIHKGGH